MPYQVEKQGDHWIVRNKQTGESKGKSKSKEEAIKHMQAMYIHEGLTKSD